MRAISTAVLFVLAACAVRLGGPSPEEYRVLALDAASEGLPSAVAERIRGSGANVVLLSASGDSAWFAGVADGAGMTLSGPGVRDGRGLAFLATEPVGDTTVALPTDAAGTSATVLLHDALYEVDDDRYLDLMGMRIDRGQDVDGAIQAFLAYVASDVMTNAAVALAVDVPDAATARRVALLLEPAFRDARECIGDPDGDDGSSTEGTTSESAPQPGLLLFYGPELQMQCKRAEVRAEAGNPIFATLVVMR